MTAAMTTYESSMAYGLWAVKTRESRGYDFTRNYNLNYNIMRHY